MCSAYALTSSATYVTQPDGIAIIERAEDDRSLDAGPDIGELGVVLRVVRGVGQRAVPVDQQPPDAGDVVVGRQRPDLDIHDVAR